jgi:hypothetical protein
MRQPHISGFELGRPDVATAPILAIRRRCRTAGFCHALGRVRISDPERPKIVVLMQHPATTWRRIVKTPKKSAFACLFCFTK